MSTVLGYKTCPQCGYAEADTDCDCGISEERTNCRQCGFCEYLLREKDSKGKVAFRHEVTEGAGVLFYRRKGAIGYTSHYLATLEEVAKAEQWLREKLAAGQVRSGSAYLSQWNKETQSVEFLIGQLCTISDYDPDDEVPEQKGSDDLRPFRLVEKRCEVKLRYSCEHLLEGWILLVKGQPIPAATAIFRTGIPCLACLPKYISSTADGAKVLAAVCEKRRARLWENRWLNGGGDYVTPAFDHPQTLEEAASRFYAAYPARKQCHPESMGFHLQLEGWSDEDIAAKKWLCECSGCRATPKSLGCKKYPG